MPHARRRPSRLVPLCAVATLALALLAGCNGDAPAAPDGTPSPPPGDPAAIELIRSDADRAAASDQAGRETAGAVQAFATDLYAILARESDGEGGGNLVFSPYSVAIALAMTRAGASGETAEQMDAVLHAVGAGDLHAGFNALEQALAERSGEYPISAMDEDEVAELILATANQLWGQRDFEFGQDFLDLLASQYGAGMRLVDYVEATGEARQAINAWVAEQTHDRIPELIPDGVLDDMTRLVLTNAVYLNAPWMHRFDEDSTAPGPFTRLDDSQVEAQMMRLSARLNYGSGQGFEAVELPYVDGSLSMVVVLPQSGGFEAFESGLDAARLRQVIDSLGDAQVNLALPRFEFRTQAGLKEPLRELGMPAAFDPAQADFTPMVPRRDDTHIQDVLHEAFISVDEHGTEAAAATAVVVGIVSAPLVQADITVDRPFLFLIRDRETGALLFMGRVMDPTAE